MMRYERRGGLSWCLREVVVVRSFSQRCAVRVCHIQWICSTSTTPAADARSKVNATFLFGNDKASFAQSTWAIPPPTCTGLAPRHRLQPSRASVSGNAVYKPWRTRLWTRTEQNSTRRGSPPRPVVPLICEGITAVQHCSRLTTSEIPVCTRRVTAEGTCPRCNQSCLEFLGQPLDQPSVPGQTNSGKKQKNIRKSTPFQL